jgi:hypothetical protein
VKERGILFSAPMVRAILAGKKAQTRRLVKADDVPEGVEWVFRESDGVWGPCRDELCRGALDLVAPARRCPYGIVGDRLWVRETFALTNHGKPVYRADCHDRDGHFWSSVAEDPDDVRWRPAIHLPRSLSRITLDVTRVRIERLQDITEGDARAEGVDAVEVGISTINGAPATGVIFDPRLKFHALWNSINAERAPWSSNPWVWVVDFKRVA